MLTTLATMHVVSSRWLNWKIDLYLMLVGLLCVVPFYQFYLLLSPYRTHPTPTIAACTDRHSTE
jgi:hypothetical protein